MYEQLRDIIMKDAKTPVSQLKTCPMCGGSAEIKCTLGLFRNEYWVECKKCGLRTMSFKMLSDDAKRNATLMWNRRNGKIDD